MVDKDLEVLYAERLLEKACNLHGRGAADTSGESLVGKENTLGKGPLSQIQLGETSLFTVAVSVSVSELILRGSLVRGKMILL
jgi:hypothetical protein